ncbi:MotA/TolQ/ExbB proton channel family protein [uncultured Tolumonas sp.]|uniref:MotA/TolQ/ExbB proton channel family protein n=1 Tax=uncultured Tolumonas sp. TaxID=263765 RepID=UPI00292EE68A|nr:MotA/TolQ/ExbB proton channel family protein [uncultured Tolumonas sp.]
MDLLTQLLIDRLDQIHVVPAGAGFCALLILIVMSLICWYEIVHRIACRLFRYIHYRNAIKKFSSLEKRQYFPSFLENLTEGALKRLSLFTWNSWQKISIQDMTKIKDRKSIMVSLIQNQLDKERLQLESGLTLLACIGACAPFVGLFGTVWGIYHALQAIGSQGSSSLDQVAGPVGEALIMTGIGLLVALPAVFAYNAFIRLNRCELAQLDSFAHELILLIVHDISLKNSTNRSSESFPLPNIDDSDKQGELL